ncbi:hypothetical protein BD410DRAFT_501261 [Rickenella mellea]|uniref:Uncharacterized protein n=1 Tax=Rickenella mellea TaxID=50990 RepID=A0A4Y7PV84_9AGAM|nr:hypothetical protein BD410DRAFT_501261 [Rickenella mellea]
MYPSTHPSHNFTPSLNTPQSTMSTPRIRSSPFASATSMFFNSLIPSGGAVSSAIKGFQALLPLRKVVTDIFLNMKLRPPPPLPPPLPPPPTRTFELFGPHLVSRTVEYAAPSTSRRCHPPSRRVEISSSPFGLPSSLASSSSLLVCLDSVSAS